jgi:hypothetical protein
MILQVEDTTGSGYYRISILQDQDTTGSGYYRIRILQGQGVRIQIIVNTTGSGYRF